MRTTTHLLSSLLLAAAASTASATDVPRGGATIDIGAGGNLHVLTLKNTTGVKGCDLTITVFGAPGVPNIEEVDVIGQGGDKVDDNNDGQIGGANEGDTVDSTPDTTCRSIFGNFKVNDNGTINVTLKLDGNLPAGSKLKVRFSTEILGRHYDLCVATGLDQPFGTTDVPVGTHLAAFTMVNFEPFPVPDFHIITPIDNPVVDLVMPPPFDFSIVQLAPDVAIVNLQPPLFPGQEVEVYVELENPATDGIDLMFRPGPALPNAGVPYGQGCPGTGDFIPQLHVAGVPSPNAPPMTFYIDDGLGGSQSIFFVGINQNNLPIGGGCSLLLDPLLTSPPLPLLPGGPGAGSIAFPIVLPGGTPPGLQFHLQAFVADPGNPSGLSSTNGTTVTTH